MKWLRYKLRKWLGLASLEFRFQAHFDNHGIKVAAAKLKALYGKVPADLEAAVQEAVDKPIERFRYYSDGDSHPYADLNSGIVDAVTETVAPLLAERDKRIKKLEELVNEVSDTLAPLQISHRHLYPWDWLNKARAYFGRPPVEESPDE